MPINLNPCVKCGGEAKRYHDAILFPFECSVRCPKCGKEVFGANHDLSGKKWNAANPKEEAR